MKHQMDYMKFKLLLRISIKFLYLILLSCLVVWLISISKIIFLFNFAITNSNSLQSSNSMVVVGVGRFQPLDVDRIVHIINLGIV